MLSEEDFDRLLEACEGHTQITHHKDPAIGACWDADRLDLGRVGIIPHPKYLNTQPAREMAATNNYMFLHAYSVRKVEELFRVS